MGQCDAKQVLLTVKYTFEAIGAIQARIHPAQRWPTNRGGTLTRRRRTGCVVAVALSVALAGTGCTGNSAADVKTAQGPAAAVLVNQINPVDYAKLKAGGVLNYPLHSPITNFNTYQLDGYNDDAKTLMSTMLPSLFTISSTNEFAYNPDYLVGEPKLTTDPAQTITYDLNPKATWSDGTRALLPGLRRAVAGAQRLGSELHGRDDRRLRQHRERDARRYRPGSGGRAEGGRRRRRLARAVQPALPARRALDRGRIQHRLADRAEAVRRPVHVPRRRCGCLHTGTQSQLVGARAEAGLDRLQGRADAGHHDRSTPGASDRRGQTSGRTSRRIPR